MAKTFKRISGTLLTSVALAAAGLFVPAPAQALDMRCQIKVYQYCSANWEALGFWSEYDCYSFWYEAACQYPNPSDPNWPYLPPVNP